MWIVERFEGDKAIIEYKGKTFNVPKETLPAKAKEGDIINVFVDKESTDKKQNEIDKLKDDFLE